MFEMFCDQYFLCIFTFSKNELLKLTETLTKTHLNFNGLNRCLFVYIYTQHGASFVLVNIMMLQVKYLLHVLHKFE